MKRSLTTFIINTFCIYLIQIFVPQSSYANTCIEDLSIRPKSGKIQLTWTHVSDAEGYEILRSRTLNGPFDTIGETQSSYSTYLDVDVDPDILYYYQIERIADNGNDRCVSNVIAGLAPGARTRLAFVPDIINVPQVTAENLITTASLTVGNVDQISSNTIPSGNVAIQDPPPNSAVPQGFTVNLTVSSGNPLITVPDVQGLPEADAEFAIINAGLSVGTITSSNSETVPQGDVISQDPLAGRMVSTATPIDLVISLGQSLVQVPDVVGLSQGDAEASVTDSGLSVGMITSSNSATVPAGDVISQDPVSGTMVPTGAGVNLIVSLGQAMVTVPDVVGLLQADAESSVRDAWLAVGAVTTANDNTVPTGHVLDQTPASGTSVAPNSPVDLVVSLGPTLVAVPDVIGFMQGPAEDTVTAAGLEVRVVSKAHDTNVPAGDVINQTPVAGTLVAPASFVDLTVSLGPQMSIVPDVSGLPKTDAEAILSTEGFTVGTISEIHDDAMTKGNVISQAPVGGSLIPVESTVDLVVSLGPDSSLCEFENPFSSFTVEPENSPEPGHSVVLYTPGSADFVGDTDSLAASVENRIGVALGALDQDLELELVTVSSSTDEVLVFMDTANGVLGNPDKYPSGGSGPATVIIDQFIGAIFPDIAVGHSDGNLTFLENNGDGSFTPRPDLPLSNLGVIVDLTANDWDEDRDTDLAVSGRDQATVLLNDNDALATSPIVNGDFSNAMIGWNADIQGNRAGEIPGKIESAGGVARLVENGSFLVSLQQTFTIPDAPVSISFDIDVDLDSPAGGVPDAFEVSLLDAAKNSVVPTFKANTTSFFNVNPGGQSSVASGVTFNGSRVTLDITSVPSGTEVTLFFDLIGNPPGNESVVVIDNVRIDPSAIATDSYTVVPLTGPFGQTAGIAHCDLNGDGHRDIVVDDIGLGESIVFLGDGSGVFEKEDKNTVNATSAVVKSALKTNTSSASKRSTPTRPIAKNAVGLAETDIVIGDIVQGSIDVADEVDTFEFDGVAEQTLFFDLHDGHPAFLTWLLEDPFGTVLFNHSGGLHDEGPLTLTETGRYRLTIDGRGSNVDSYEFEIIEVPPTKVTSIEIGEIVSGEITVPGETDEFIFNISDPLTVFFNLMDGSPSLLTWLLKDPTGNVVFNHSGGISDEGPRTLTEVGEYRLTVDGRGANSDTYQFQIVVVPKTEVIPIELDAIVIGKIDVPGSMIDYVFDGTTGQRLFFDVKIGSASVLQWILTDPNGQSIFFASIGDRGPIELTTDGEYTLTVDGRFDVPGEFQFRIWEIPEEVPQTIPFDTPITSAIYIPGQTRSFQFNGNANQEIQFDLFFGSSFFLLFDLVSPSGAEVFADVTNSHGPLVLPENGTYTLTTRNNGDRLFNFAFQIIDGDLPIQVPLSSDLIIEEILVPSRTIGNPAQFEVTLVVKNEGTESVPAATEILHRLYLSADDAYSISADPLIAECEHALSSSLGNGQSFECTQSMTMFPNYSGEFRIIAEVDVRNDVLENISAVGFDDDSEKNNIGVSNPTAVFPESRDVIGGLRLVLDNEDGAEFPAGSTVNLTGQARAVAGSVNIVYVIDVSGSTEFVTELDSNFDGILDENDDMNQDKRVGDILDSEIGSLLKLTEFFAEQAENINVSVIPFGSRTIVFPNNGAEPIDLSPGLFNQTFHDPLLDDDKNAVPDAEQAARTVFYANLGLASRSGATAFRSFLIGTGTDFKEAIAELDGVLERAPDADETLVFFLTDGEPNPGNEPTEETLQILADRGLRFHGFQITGNAVTDAVQRMADLVDAHPSSSGIARLVTDPNDLTDIALDTVKVVEITINGVSVQNFDSTGNFFNAVTLVEGDNVFVIEAIYADGNRTEATITLVGVNPNENPFSQFQDSTSSGEFAYQATTFNRKTNTLLTEAMLTNTDNTILGAPVLAVFNEIRPPSVQLANAEDLTPEGHPYVTFDDELGPAGLAPNATSASVELEFSNPTLSRFDFDITLLALGNTAPTISSIPPTITEGSEPYEYAVLAVDTEKDPLFYELLQSPARMVIDPDTGAIAWTPNNSDIGTHNVEIKVTDGRGGSATQVFNLLVFEPLPANNPPLITTNPPTLFSLNPTNTGGNLADRQYVYDVNAVDADNDPLTYVLLAQPNGMTIGIDTGTIVWDPTDVQIGNHEVTVEVTDGNGGVDVQFFEVTVALSSPNQSPQFLSDPLNRIHLGNFYSYTPTVVDPDFDILTFALVTGPTDMTIDNATGRLSWTPDGNDLGIHPISVEVSDNFGATDTQTYDLSVVQDSENEEPSIVSSPITGATVGEKYRYPVKATDPDGDQLTFSLLVRPTGMAIDPESGVLVWRPHGSQIGSHDVTLQVVDGFGGQATQTFQIQVSEDNVAPVIVSAPPLIATINEMVSYIIDSFDADGDDTEVSLISGPNGMVFDANSSTLSWTPMAAEVGGYRVELRVTDSKAAAGHQSFIIQVRDTNTAPQFTSDPITSVTLGDTYRYDADATDPDDEVTYDVIGAPTGLTINRTTGLVLWSPTSSDIGDHPLTIEAADERGTSSQQDYILSVLADTVPPVVTILPSSNPINPGDTVSIQVIASDNDAITDIEFEIDGIAVSLDSFNMTEFTATAPGLVPLTGTATDATGNVGTTTINLRIIDPNDSEGPEVDITSPAPEDVVTYLTDIVGSVTAPDLEFYRLEYARADRVDLENMTVNDPNWHTFGESDSEVTNGVLGEFDPTLLCNDDYAIRVLAQDFSGNITVKALTLGVSGTAKLGQFSLEFTDLTIPLAGIPIEITRSYNTVDADNEGDFGFGWTLKAAGGDVRETVPLGLEPQAGIFGANPIKIGTRVYLTDPDGKRVGFTFDPDPSVSLLGTIFTPRFVPDPGVFDQLEVDNVAISQRSDGTFGLFLIGLPYNPSSYRLIRKDGTVYHYDQFSGLQKVTDPNSNELVYTDEGIFHSSGESIQFVRDAEGRIIEIIDPDGNSLAYGYNSLGELVSFTDQTGVVTQFTYLDEPAHYLDEMIDPLGRMARRTEYDEDGRVTAVIDALGNRQEQNWDPENFKGTFTNGRGHLTEIVYDSRGNKIQETDPLGGVSTWVYDDNDNPISFTDGKGDSTIFTYDGRGNILTQADALGSVTTFTYNEFSDITSITDPLGRVETFVYDNNGNRMEMINAEGDSVFYTYDDQGRFITATNLKGDLYRLTYELFSNPTEIINPDGTSMVADYNRFGQVVHHVDETGVTTSFDYDSAARLITERDGNGNETKYTYNAHLLVSQTDALNRTERFEYDDAGRLIRSFDSSNGKTEFTFDADGNRTSVTDPLGNTTIFVYDALNRLTEQVDPLGNSVSFVYDAVGNRIEINDRNDRRRTFEYDELNRVLKETWFDSNNAVSHTISSTYDTVGNRLSISDPNSAYSFSYDELNRQTRIDNIGTPNLPHVVLSYDYDVNGNRASAGDNFGTQVNTSYDQRDRITRKIWDGSQIDSARIDFSYDDCGCGRRTLIERFADIDALQSVGSTRYVYDNLGRLTNLVHANSTNNAVAEYTYSYDAVHRTTAKTHHDQTFDYVYNQTGQLTEALRSIADNERFEYDDNGNRISNGGDVGENNQILADNDFDFDYDAEGNLIAKLEIVTGNVTEYSYDHRNRLIRVEERDANDSVVTDVEFVYDALDRRIGKITDNITIMTVYDGDNAWADFDENGNLSAQYLFGDRDDEILARYRPGESTTWYLGDKLGSIHDLMDSNGVIINHIDYDSFGGVRGQTDVLAGDRFLFTGREFDAETGLYYYRARYYDPKTGRFMSEDPTGFDAGDPNLYRYVNNAPLDATDPTGKVAAIEYFGLACDIGAALGFAIPVATELHCTFNEIAFALENGAPSPNFNPNGAAAGLPSKITDLLPCGVGIIVYISEKISNGKVCGK